MRKYHYFVILFILILAANLIAQPKIDNDPFWQSSEINVFSSGIIWRDCNGDGYVDVFFSNGNDIVEAKNNIYISSYGVLPSSATWYSVNNEYSGHSAVGDIDDNGYPDWVVANYIGADGFSTANLANLYYNMNGFPNITPDWYSGDSIYNFANALGDFDNDGDLDLVVATGEIYESVYLPDRIYYNINGQLQSLPGWQSTYEDATLDVTVGDVDKDGDLDIAFASDGIGAGIYYNNNGTIEASPSWQSANTEPANTLIFGDVNGDGWLDLVVAFNKQLGGDGYFMVYFNDGSGNLNPVAGWQSSTGGYGSGVAMYDYDNDGDEDLAAGSWGSNFVLYENIGGTFTTSPVWQANPSTLVEEMAWVDVDGDGLEWLIDTIPADGSRKLFYTKHHPLYAIDSVIMDGSKLADPEYCYDMVYGWLSLVSAPVTEIKVFYKYSFKNDITISNWDTFNMAFEDTSKPLIDFYADTTFGWAPLEVQFTDSSINSNNWNWGFDDGSISSEQNPIHTFETGGAFNVSLTAQLPDAIHNHTERNMVVVLGDTIYFKDTLITTQNFSIPVYLSNSIPMEQLILPIYYGGDVDLDLTGFNTDGCRTDYFYDVKKISHNDPSSQVVLNLKSTAPGLYNPLPPGSGKVLNLEFTQNTGLGNNQFDSTTLNFRSLQFEAGFIDFVPRVIDANIQVGICGDVNGQGDGTTISDITYYVGYMFQWGDAPPLETAADVDGSGALLVSDLTYMVAYLFQSGPAPHCGL
ncbi:MAG: hypothetical protein DRP35_07060 [Candidatus Zixiibacteriota bacterium]|nr:MAG: hypothetical protein DRP35_07060 [candidate division Zixibacteria bacterium]